MENNNRDVQHTRHVVCIEVKTPLASFRERLNPLMKNIRKERQYKELLEDVKEMGRTFKE